MYKSWRSETQTHRTIQIKTQTQKIMAGQSGDCSERQSPWNSKSEGNKNRILNPLWKLKPWAKLLRESNRSCWVVDEQHEGGAMCSFCTHSFCPDPACAFVFLKTFHLPALWRPHYIKYSCSHFHSSLELNCKKAEAESWFHLKGKIVSETREEGHSLCLSCINTSTLCRLFARQYILRVHSNP